MISFFLLAGFEYFMSKSFWKKMWLHVLRYWKLLRIQRIPWSTSCLLNNIYLPKLIYFLRSHLNFNVYSGFCFNKGIPCDWSCDRALKGNIRMKMLKTVPDSLSKIIFLMIFILERIFEVLGDRKATDDSCPNYSLL